MALWEKASGYPWGELRSLSFGLPVFSVIVVTRHENSSGFQLHAANNCPEAFCSDINSLLFIVVCQSRNSRELEAFLGSKG